MQSITLNPPMKTSTLKLSLLTALATLMCAFGLHAADLTWDADTLTTGAQDGIGVWDTTTNTWWDSANNVVWNNATPDNATFGAGSGTALTVTNTVAITVGNITYNAAGSGSYTNSGSSANPMTLSSSIITNNADSSLNLVLAGTGFTKEGTGALFLRPPANNTYSGTTIVNNGRLVLNSSTASRILIPGNLTINSGATVTNTGSTGSIAAPATVTVNAGGILHAGTVSFDTLVLNGGTAIQNSTETLTINNVDARSGSIVQATGATGKLDAGTLTKSTSGTVTDICRGSSATTGGITNTVVNAGTLILDYVQTSKLNDSGTLTVNGGALVFANGAYAEKIGSVTLAGGVITNASGTSSLTMTASSYDVRTGEVYTVLSGATALIKSTPGTVILGSASDYSLGTLISGGILQLGNGGSAGQAGSTSKGITNNATLAFNHSDTALSISGVISGSGSVVQFGSGTVALTGANTYSGSTTISNGAISLNSSSTLGDGTSALNLSGGTLTTTASRTASSAPVSNAVNVTADSAITTTSTSSTVDLNLNNDSISGSAGTLAFSNAAASGTGVFQPRFSGSSFNFSRPIVIANGGFGTTRLDSYNTNGTSQTFSGVISGNGSYRRSGSTTARGGTTIMSAANTYSGTTTVSDGLLLVNGSIGTGAVTVSGAGGLAGILGGNGTINGPVTVSSGGMVSPGASIGILTISNSLTFQSGSTCYIELNNSIPTNDLVRGITTVTYAGTLTVTNLSGTLAANNTFKLFDATTYTGSFSATNLPTLAGGLAWDTTGLTSNGSIKVVSTGASPTLNVSQSGSALTFSWTGSGFKLQSQTNSLTVGLLTNSASWIDYPGGSTSPVGVTINPASPSVFFRLSQ